jgi:hypothetical protein
MRTHQHAAKKNRGTKSMQPAFTALAPGTLIFQRILLFSCSGCFQKGKAQSSKAARKSGTAA